MRCRECGTIFDACCPSCGAMLSDISEAKVGDVMTKDVVSVETDTPIREVMRIIRDRDLNALPVIDGHKDLIGIVSQKDLMLRDEWFDALWSSSYGSRMFMDSILRKMSSTVDKIMVRDVITVTKEDTIRRAAELMVKDRKNQLPVVDGRRLVGIISRKDIVKLMMDNED